MKICLTLTIIALFLSVSVTAQNYETYYKKAQYNTAKYLIKKQLQRTGDTFTYHLKMAEAFEREKKIDSTSFHLAKLVVDSLFYGQQADYYYLKAKVYDRELNQTEEALTAYTEARKRFKKSGDIKKLNKIRYDLFYLLLSDENTFQNAYKNLDSLYNESKEYKDTTGQILANLGMAAFYFKPVAKDTVQDYLNRAYQLSKASGDLPKIENTMSYLGLHYLYNVNDYKQAEIWLDSSLLLSSQMKNTNTLFYSYLNRATLPRAKGNYKEALNWLYRADSIDVSTYNLNLKAELYANMAKDFQSLNQLDSTINYLRQHVKYKDSVKALQQAEILIDFGTLETREENVRIREENVQINEKNERITYAVWSLGGVALALAIIGALGYTNQQRKRKIAEQKQQLEKAKVKQLVKEQELQAIDAMISGQEKERQRLANELHDNLGSLLVTLKLHFENYKNQAASNHQENLLNNTDDLLEEAYQKVRGMAHARNTGVVARYGLIPAVENFAAKISATQQLNINVVHNDFTDRLENTLELSIFRMTQELITNVIKHANATQVHLELVRHEEYINILIEDNGIGFDPQTLSKKNSMGLSSIKKRVEVNGGITHIDSVPGHGTTVSIDLPLAKTAIA